MYSLKIALLLAFALPSMEQHEPISAWLDAPSTKSLPATYSQADKTINFDFALSQEFAGEIAIISSASVAIHQDYYSFKSGTHQLSTKIDHFNKDQYLVVFHDLERRFLKTIKITVKESDK